MSYHSGPNELDLSSISAALSLPGGVYVVLRLRSIYNPQTSLVIRAFISANAQYKDQSKSDNVPIKFVINSDS